MYIREDLRTIVASVETFIAKFGRKHSSRFGELSILAAIPLRIDTIPTVERLVESSPVMPTLSSAYFNAQRGRTAG
jgi:hypothetical protein